jgi:outer membrane protein, heavy metal efflux system
MSQGRRAWFLLAAWSCLLGISRASPPGSGTAVLVQSDLGGAPISGRVGPSGPRISSDLSNPSNLPSPIPDQTRIAAPAPRPTTAAPSYGSFELTTGSEDDGPPSGLTLDLAIERLLKESLDLRGKYYEIPQAEADVLNAGLRANPIFYADGQLVPYGSYSRNRPGGQTQYDVNLSIPMDLSHKRQARTVYASSATRVIEAQYQNAVRVAIDQLYGAFLDVLSARQAVRYSEAGVKGFEQLYHVTLELYRRDQNTRADVYRVQTQLYISQVGLIDARENLRKANRALGVLLNLPPQQAEKLEVRGTIQDLAAGPPPLEALVPMALALRPDVVSFRLGIKTAEANVRLQLANRFSDVYLLYQPYTFQDNSPFGEKSPTSWALGMTVPLPLYNRNQGNIARAHLNVAQSQIELAQIERQVVTDVQQALSEYRVTAQMVEKIRNQIEPTARQARDDTRRLYLGGEVNVVVFLGAQRDYNDMLKQYLDTVVRHRRAMLALNTVLGQRILP